MAVRGLLALVDDIATLTKIAAKKTAGLSGDDLAVNAHALAGQGIDPKRELPMVWKVAKGSFKNKFKILIPAAMGLSIVAPWAIPPLMMVGGAFLVYEGMEKMLHKNKHGQEGQPPKDPKAIEDERVAGAIKTDFILSAEIIVVALGAVAAAPLLTQLGVLAAVGVTMTAGIYGLVAGLVKLDDLGIHLAEKTGDGFLAKASRKVGQALIQGVPPMMKGLSFLGTAAMFAVGGGILLHGIPALGHAVLAAGSALSSSPFIAAAVETAASIGLGMLTGLAAIPVVKVLKEPVMHLAGLAKAAYDEKIGKPARDYAKKLWGKVWGHSPAAAPAEPVNDNTVREPVAAPGGLQSVSSIKEAHDAAAAKPVEPILPEEVKPPAPEFSAFEKNLTRNFGK